MFSMYFFKFMTIFGIFVGSLFLLFGVKELRDKNIKTDLKEVSFAFLFLSFSIYSFFSISNEIEYKKIAMEIVKKEINIKSVSSIDIYNCNESYDKKFDNFIIKKVINKMDIKSISNAFSLVEVSGERGGGYCVFFIFNMVDASSLSYKVSSKMYIYPINITFNNKFVNFEYKYHKPSGVRLTVKNLYDLSFWKELEELVNSDK